MANPSLKDTGERMIPTAHRGKVIYGEHIGRYIATVDVVKGKRVLDIASGSGYGTAMLSQYAKNTIGVDIDAPSVAYAQKQYGANNCNFIVGSGTSIPLEDNSVDVVVSMETIEHIEDQDSFLSEVTRVLTSEGLFIVSTPNDKVYPKGNHYHVKEHNKRSLKELLDKHFKQSEFYYQNSEICTTLVSENKIQAEQEHVDWQVKRLVSEKPDHCLYYYVVCSNNKTNYTLQENTIISENFSHMHQKDMFDELQQSRQLQEKFRHETKQFEEENQNLREQVNTLQAKLNNRISRKAVRLVRIVRTKLNKS